ncbi:hypothetical protein XH98_20735 [Bradyrhizobium sp. CCBAU 51745]|nr:hypothetical protein [Bradyrhizobium sp. CCBAU 51745]
MQQRSAPTTTGWVIYTQHQVIETEDKRIGKHPLVYFEEIGVLEPNVSFVHMKSLRDDEMDGNVRGLASRPLSVQRCR